MKAINIPAIRGKIGNTIFYCTTLTFKQISEMVKKVDGELHTATSLKEQIQRSLTTNYIQIKEYILNRNDRFFDSLVLAVYDGDPLWKEVRYEIDNEVYCNVGLLEFSGQEKIFPVDGQHRVEGIRAALLDNEDLGNETISVMMIGHQNTVEGRKKSRRIFSTLNRYVKPVRLGDIIALDEDDIVAIVTRELLETYPLFIGEKIKATNSKSIPSSDKVAFTSLMTLYSCHLSLYSTFLKLKHNKRYNKSQISETLKYRPTDVLINDFLSYLIDFWNSMRQTFEELEQFVNDVSEKPALELRSTDTGGNLLFRPAGLLPFVEAVSVIKAERNDSFSHILSQFSSINCIISLEPWKRILWNPLTHKMIMKNQSLVKYFFLYMYDSALLSENDKNKMYAKYASLLGINSIEESKNTILQIVHL